jgi:hypothetical protein
VHFFVRALMMKWTQSFGSPVEKLQSA